jgi:hypothetical protein
MAEEIKHLSNEEDIGSGDKTPAQKEISQEISHLAEDQEKVRKEARPQDGSKLHQVIEEQQYIQQQESHTPDIQPQEGHDDQDLSAESEDDSMPANEAIRPANNGTPERPQHR